MSELFGRKMRLEVGVPGEQGRSWDGLRLTSSIKKSARPAPNEATITVTNLNADSRAWLERPDLACQMFAGYEDAPGLLFAGQVDEVAHAYAGTEWTTTIQARDGSAAFQALTDTPVWRGPLNSNDVLRRVAAGMGLKLPSLPSSLPVVDFPDGFTAGRHGRATLDALAEELDFTWSIQNGALVVAARGEPTSPRIRLFKAGTGLIGSPEKNKRGVTLKVQLDGGITPGDLVQVESKVVSGTYLVRTVEHNADSHEDGFITTMEAIRR